MVERIVVKTDFDEYSVIIGNALDYGRIASHIFMPCKVVIVSDDNVFPLYGEAAVRSFAEQGFETVSYVIKHGEASKNLSTVERLLHFLAEHNLTRSDFIAALGGGVVGDITGFAAAVYLRGIRFIQLPTTLLAAVDSSVGGKTGVDMPAGKNLVGAFHQPAAVFCDTDTFTTLPGNVYSDGMAEVIKHCVIGDAEMLDSLTALSPVEICMRNVRIKANIVEQDGYDNGIRRWLNFGHTIGHAAEHLSGYKISHGSAVAIGMVTITRASERLGWTNEPCLPQLIEALKHYGLPVSCGYSAKELAQAALIDKKRMGDTVSLIIPEKIGSVTIKRVNVTELEDIIAAGLSE
jgi:3-dehydroquinate synthase